MSGSVRIKMGYGLGEHDFELLRGHEGILGPAASLLHHDTK